MLKTLTVENYALIEKLELGFSDSLNIITGETGAGKSILLGALGLLLGNRCDATAVKDRSRNCVVEGVFEIGGYDLEDFFTENDLDYDPVTVVRRVVSPEGRGRAYINDLPVQQTMLREFGAFLIDIHSQHQSLMLGQDGFRINILDSVAGQKELIASYSKTYHRLRTAERELERLREDSTRNRQDEEWLQHQVNELATAKLSEGEQEELESQQNELSHSEEIRQALGLSSELLSEDESGILVKLKSIEQQLTHVMEYYPRSREFTERIRTTLLELRDIERELSSEAERIDSDPLRLQNINDRLNTIYSLQHKHKVANTTELLALQDDYQRRLEAISGGDEAISQMQEAITKLTSEATGFAKKITSGRAAAAKKITTHVEQTLDSLGMPGSKFIVEINPAGCLRATGADDIKFLFSANKNVTPAPVEKIASGGEVSRLMLALKSLVARSGKLPTIIFDEIDTGVSGRIADAMGNIINELSQSMQVLNITHLPQVASKGNNHFYVYKEQDTDAPRTMIRRLTDAERVDEIAKMLSGSTTTDAAYTQAMLLLGQ